MCRWGACGWSGEGAAGGVLCRYPDAWALFKGTEGGASARCGTAHGRAIPRSPHLGSVQKCGGAGSGHLETDHAEGYPWGNTNTKQSQSIRFGVGHMGAVRCAAGALTEYS